MRVVTLRPLKKAAYIFTSQEMFFFNSGIAKKINITIEKLNALKTILGFSENDVDKGPKVLSDVELDMIAETANCWRFSRMCIVDYEVSKSEVVKFDCVPNNSSSLIVNQKVKEILEKIAPDDVQFFPTILRCKDGVLDNYWLINVTHTINSIDHKKSVYERMDDIMDEIYSFDYLICKPDSLKSFHLAREKEDLGLLLISNELKAALEREKITGVWLPKPEERFNGSISADDLIDEYERDND